MVIDGHNDLVLRLWRGEEPAHVQLERARESGFAGGFFALHVPGPRTPVPETVPYALPLPAPIPRSRARAVAVALAGVLERLDVTIVRAVGDIVPEQVNAIMHLEGAEALDPGLGDLGEWYARGLRSIGVTWSRPNAFACGVPFRFPSSPDIGAGLTDQGRRLVGACNFRGIVVDVSHLNEEGFWDVARISQAPLVATHSNPHALSPASRNLTDRQLDAIGASGGIVGVSFACAFLRHDGRADPATPLERIVDHIDYVATRIGVDHVGFGSDFEGAVIPDALGGITGLPALCVALRARGYDDDALAKITHANWLRVLGETWSPWLRYLRVADADPRSTLVDALARFAGAGQAVDLGAGSGRDSAALLARGWRVVAIDSEPDAIQRLHRLVGPDCAALRTTVGRFEDARWPACDLVNASFSLPFCAPESFPALWERIAVSLRPGGRFSGQLFGERDQWAASGIVTHTRGEVEELLAPFAIERLDEEERDGTTVAGTRKHWHVFHIVARKG